MKNKEMYIYIEFMCFGISAIAFLFANLLQEPVWSVICLIMLCVGVAVYLIKNFSEKIGMVFYFVCMFTFLIAGAILPVLIGEENWMSNLSVNEYIVACNCLFISSISILLGERFFKKYHLSFRHSRNENSKLQESSILSDKHFNINRVQKVAFIFFLATIIIVLIGEFQKLQFILRNGYLASYTQYTSPSIVIRAQIINLTSWFIGLAAKPSKKRVWIYLILGGLIGLNPPKKEYGFILY